MLGEVGLKDKLSFWKDLPRRRPVSTEDVFCNRELKLGNLRAVGFDMDYTIVQYKQPAFDQLAFDGAVDKLVNVLGYPKELADLVDKQTRSKNEWIDLFDLVVVGSCKPAYLIDPYLNLCE